MVGLMEAKHFDDSRYPAHDLFVKDTSTEIPGCFLVIVEVALTKEEYSWFDWSKAEFSKDVFVDKQGREIRADLVCEVPLTPEMQQRFFELGHTKIKKFKLIILVEHKSYNDKMVCKQLIKILSLSNDDDCLILPIVLYHGQKPWTAPLSLRELKKQTTTVFQDPKIYEAFGENTPDFKYRLVDLNKITEDELKAMSLTYEAFLYTLKTIWDLEHDTEKVLKAVAIRAEKMPSNEIDIFVQKIWNYFRVKYPGLITQEDIMKAAVRVGAKKVAQRSRTLEDCVQQQAEEIAMAKGLEQGLEQGARETQRQMVADLLALMAPEKISKHCKVPLDVVLDIQRRKSKK